MLFIKIKHFSKKSVSQYTYGLSSQPRTPTNQFKFLLCRKKMKEGQHTWGQEICVSRTIWYRDSLG